MFATYVEQNQLFMNDNWQCLPMIMISVVVEEQEGYSSVHFMTVQ